MARKTLVTSRRRFGCTLPALLLLGACGLPDGEPTPAPAEAGPAASPIIAEPVEAPAPKTDAVEAPPQEKAAAEKAPSDKKSSGAETAPRLAMRPTNKMAPPDPGRLIGMGLDEVSGLLGSPAFERKDDPALVWQYRGGACILDIFLYKKGAAYSVAHIEVRGLSVVEVDRNACFLGLLHERAKAG